MDQFIRGLHNKTLQTYILAKTGYLKSHKEIIKHAKQIIKHAKPFESALWDQVHLHQRTNSAARISAYKKSRSNASKPWYNKLH